MKHNQLSWFCLLLATSLLFAACLPGPALPIQIPDSQPAVRPLAADPFHEEQKGYTIRYPAGWQYEWRDYGDEVLFSPPAGSAESGRFPLTVSIGAAPLGLFAPESSETLDEQRLIQILIASLNMPEDTEIGPIQRLDGAHEIAFVDLRMTVQDQALAGRLAAVVAGEKGGVVLGVGERAAWQAFVPTFEEMLMSMAFEESGP